MQRLELGPFLLAVHWLSTKKNRLSFQVEITAGKSYQREINLHALRLLR